MKQILNILGFFILFSAFTIQAQSVRKYEIGGINVEGTFESDPNFIINVSGLKIGNFIRVPGEDLSKAIKKLWASNLFEDVNIRANKVTGATVFLVIEVKQRVKLTRFTFKGLKNSDVNKIREEIKLYSGLDLSEAKILETRTKIRQYFIEKGYYNAQIDITQKRDEIANGVILTINVKKGPRTKIKVINISGNKEFKTGKIRRTMKETKQRNFFRVWKQSKYINSAYEADKQAIIQKYRSKGYRDAKIISDSMYVVDDKNLQIDLVIDEGNKYYFRNITWSGNTKYRSSYLDTVLSIQKGEVYNEAMLSERLNFSMTGFDVSSLYMDNGYLTFQAIPVELNVENDSIDLEIRIYEGKQFRIGNIYIQGNYKTRDHVILREVRTLPGDLFNRNELVRTQRELSQLQYFNPETMNIRPVQHPETGTVDLVYEVEEKPSDQVELSAGWGGGFLVGTVGLTFNNFAAKRLFEKEAWKPLPSGDGQRVSLRLSATGLNYQNYSLSFTEPWLGGKKPHSMTVSLFHSVLSNGRTAASGERQSFLTTGGGLSFGQRLKWPDDYFVMQEEISYQRYDLNDYGGVFSFTNGIANNLSFRLRLSRNSIDQPIYPRSGSEVALSVQFTAPYSYFDGRADNEYADLPDEDKFKWAEYHKWKFTAEWFTPISKDNKLVLRAKIGYGLLATYNSAKGISPFERFTLGGSGLTGGFGQFVYGQEIVALRGYDEKTVSPQDGNPIVAKYTMELRYPISLNPQATVFVLGFAEAGNTWGSFKNFNPFNVKRSAGVGVRIFLPMFGLLGLDYGWGFDTLNEFGNVKQPGSGQFHFTLGMNIGEL